MGDARRGACCLVLYAIPFGSLVGAPLLIGFSAKSLWTWLPGRQLVLRDRSTLSVPYHMHMLAKDGQSWLTVALLVAVIVQITQTGFLH
jgi:ABC-type microcin C transport system permease subunit YejB